MERHYCLNQGLRSIQWIGCAVVTIAGSILLTHGCTSFQTTTTREIVYDTVVVRVQDTALVGTRGERPSRVITFSYPYHPGFAHCWCGDCSLELEVIGGNTPRLRPHPDERIDDRQPAS